MSFPLGPRHVPVTRKARKITLKPPSDEYMINVNIAPYIVHELDTASSLAPSRISSLGLPPTVSPVGIMVTHHHDSFVGMPSTRTSASGTPTHRRRESLTDAPAGGSQRGTPVAGAAANLVRSLRDSPDYALCASNALTVHLHVNDTVSTAIEKVVASYNAVKPKPLPRPAAHYMLCRCFADYSVDFSMRSLHGDSPTPLLELLTFPYYLSLQVIPYQQHRETIENQTEPAKRSALREEHRGFMVFALEYAAMLRRMQQQYEFLIGRDAEARRQKKELEVQARHQVLQRMLYKSERECRADLVAEEAQQWIRESFTAKAILEHCATAEEWFAQTSREMRLGHRRWLFILDTAQRLATLNARMEQLVQQREGLFDCSLQAHRAAYTEARIASHVSVAQSTSEDVEMICKMRLLHTKSVEPHHYQLPSVVNRELVCDDPYSFARSSGA